jgi:UDP-N-acetylglucosamine--N-acetylmuramyl-(pentapeptide) pyrophosphoryl-undecaprenol N-acetylglucosamine transferase
MEQGLVERAGLPYRGIDTGQMRGINPVMALVNAGRMVKGVRQSLAILESFRPDVCLVTGGYVCAPVVMACRLRRVPVLIYLPDIVPGWAIRSLSWLAQRVAVTFPAAAGAFGGQVPQGKAVVTGYPLRPELVKAVGGGRLDAAAHAENRRSAWGCR